MSRALSFQDLVADGILCFGDGYRTKRSELADGGYRIIRVADISSGTVNLAGPDHVGSKFAGTIGNKAGRPNDILVTTKGTVGRVAVLPELTGRVVYSPQVCYFRVEDERVLDRGFLRYWFSSPEFWAQAQDRMNKTDMAAYINLADIQSLKVSLPSINEQHGVASVLGALDDKIAANAELARTADDLSGAYYSQMLGDANDRPLSSIASFTNGRAFTKGASGTGRVVVRIAELNSGIGPSTVRSNAAVADQYTARAGDILFAWSGSLTVNRWYRPEAIVNQHIFKVEPVDGFPRWLVFRALRAKLSEFRNIAADKATTMGHIQRYHLDDAVSLPDRPEIGARDALMTALWNRALAAEKESLALTELRDTLLPHLMSGRLKVQDAEKTVSDAV